MNTKGSDEPKFSDHKITQGVGLLLVYDTSIGQTQYTSIDTSIGQELPLVRHRIFLENPNIY